MDQILLDEPAESGTFGSTLLREAIESALGYERRWATYADAEHEPAVLPILVVQVPDKSSEVKLAEIVGVIDSQWPGLGPDAVVNVFGEHKDLDVTDRRIRWVNPESIQDEVEVRVVLAKEAISTGWDCPRAEVLYSERPATDSTHIAQVIGRMVRQPLTRRVPTDDFLNSVACYLPLFNRKSLTKIKDELERPGEGVPPEVVVRSRLFPRSEKVTPEVFDVIESLPSVPTPDPLASALRRAKMLAKLLTDDEVAGGALMAEAGARLTKVLNSKLDGLSAQYAEQVAETVENIESAEIRRATLTHTGQELGTATRSIATHAQDLDRDTRRVIRSVREGVGTDHLAYRRRKDGDADPRDVRVEVAALLMIKEVIAELDMTATEWVQERLTKFAVDIKNTTGATRDAYMKVQEQTSRLERSALSCQPTRSHRPRTPTATRTRCSNVTSTPMSPGNSPPTSTTGRPRSSTPSSGESRLPPGTATPPGPPGHRCGSRTRMRAVSGSRCRSTSSSCLAATMARSSRRSSIPTGITLPTRSSSSGRWPTTPRRMAAGSFASNRWPKSARDFGLSICMTRRSEMPFVGSRAAR